MGSKKTFPDHEKRSHDRQRKLQQHRPQSSAEDDHRRRGLHDLAKVSALDQQPGGIPPKPTSMPLTLALSTTGSPFLASPIWEGADTSNLRAS